MIRIRPGSCSVKPQSDLLATKQLHWSGQGRVHFRGGNEGASTLLFRFPEPATSQAHKFISLCFRPPLLFICHKTKCVIVGKGEAII